MTHPVRRRSVLTAALLVLLLAVAATTAAALQAEDLSFLSWSAKHAEAVIRAMDKDGRVGGFFDTRILSTNRSYNYKLSATWLTPEVIRAGARMAQLDGYLSDDATRQLVSEAEAAGDTVVLVEIDPREGSGVIPLEWRAFLRPKGDETRGAPGVVVPALRRARALAGRLPRNYDYDRFWVVFPLQTAEGQPLFHSNTAEAELVVRIYDKEGRVTWRVPGSVLTRMAETRSQQAGPRTPDRTRP